MTKTYVPALIRISLPPAHWTALEELARENRLTSGELISDYLEDVLQMIIEEAGYIDEVQRGSGI